MTQQFMVNVYVVQRLVRIMNCKIQGMYIGIIEEYLQNFCFCGRCFGSMNHFCLMHKQHTLTSGCIGVFIIASRLSSSTFILPSSFPLSKAVTHPSLPESGSSLIKPMQFCNINTLLKVWLCSVYTGNKFYFLATFALQQTENSFVHI